MKKLSNITRNQAAVAFDKEGNIIPPMLIVQNSLAGVTTQVYEEDDLGVIVTKETYEGDDERVIEFLNRDEEHPAYGCLCLNDGDTQVLAEYHSEYLFAIEELSGGYQLSETYLDAAEHLWQWFMSSSISASSAQIKTQYDKIVAALQPPSLDGEDIVETPPLVNLTHSRVLNSTVYNIITTVIDNTLVAYYLIPPQVMTKASSGTKVVSEVGSANYNVAYKLDLPDNTPIKSICLTAYSGREQFNNILSNTYKTIHKEE